MSFRPDRTQYDPRSHYENSEDPPAETSEARRSNAEHENAAANGQDKMGEGSLAMELRHTEMGVGAGTLE